MNEKRPIREIKKLFWKTEKEFRKNGGEYWQGKKDGLRTALALIDDTIDWQLQTDTSLTGGRQTEEERLLDLIGFAYHIMHYSVAYNDEKYVKDRIRAFMHDVRNFVNADVLPVEVIKDDENACPECGKYMGNSFILNDGSFTIRCKHCNSIFTRPERYYDWQKPKKGESDG